MRKQLLIASMILFIFLTAGMNFRAFSQNYPVIDTGQDQYYDTVSVISTPQPGDPFYGQDAQYQGIQPAYQDNGDGTVTDLNTGLMWQKNLLEDKLTYDLAHAAADTFSLAGYDDWRLPTIKELYSLIDFTGVTGTSASESTPYINTNYFEFRYGDETVGERFIDAQYISGTDYVGTTMNGQVQKVAFFAKARKYPRLRKPSASLSHTRTSSVAVNPIRLLNMAIRSGSAK